MADKLKNFDTDKAYCSLMGKAKETLQILSQGRNVEFLEDQGLEEINFGVFEG